MLLSSTVHKIGTRLCCCQATSSNSQNLTRLFSTDVNVAELELNKRRPYKPRGINPRDQFGLLCRGGDMPQTEKLKKDGFENPWLARQKQGEQLLVREMAQNHQKWEMDADKFKSAPVISLPYGVMKKMEKRKRREVREYKKAISFANKFKNE